jgi:hypothetical protein
MQVFAGHSGPVNCGEFTPDGRLQLKPRAYPSLKVFQAKGLSLQTKKAS